MVSTNVKFIAQPHLDEWVEGSAVSEAIAKLNIETLNNSQMNEIVKPKYPIKSQQGWQCRGVNWRTGEPMGTRYGQVKPDSPHIIDPEKNPEKTAKYLTPSGTEPDAIFLAMPEPDYWQKVYDNKDIPRHWTEGGKKAGAGLSIGLATIALTGVWNWGKDGKLSPEVDKWVEFDTVHCIEFDSDYAKNPSCRAAILKFAKLIEAKGAIPLIVTWDSKYKGMDDFIKEEGEDAFKEAIANAKTIEEWEKQFDNTEDESDGRSKEKKIKPSVLAWELAEAYRDKLAWNNENKTWMRYGVDMDGVWSVESNEFIESMVRCELDNRGIDNYSFSHISNIYKLLRTHLIVRNWVEARNYLPFQNGVLEISTGKLLPHSPSYRLTWQLPRQHNPLATSWNCISDFLDHLTGSNAKLKNLLICFCNAVLKGRHDLQKFLHLIGLGGTGKGSFARLIESLIGSQNVHITTVDEWCNNRFEGANAYRKRLVLFPDEDKATGKLGKFLSLTGEDGVRNEEKGIKAFNYKYEGMVLVLSNIPIFTGDSASRVKRRAITVPCNNQVPVIKRRNLGKDFEPELAAFTNYVLSIPDETVTRTLLGLEEIPECTLEFWENRIRVDSIASWINTHVIYDQSVITSVGSDRNEGSDGSTPRTLFGSYNQHCRAVGDMPKSHKNFSPDLLELCRTVLGWEVERKVTATGKFIKGIRLRTDNDGDIPTHDYTLMQRVTVSDGSGDGSSDGSEPLQNKTFSESDGKNDVHEQKNDEKTNGKVNEVKDHQPTVETQIEGVNTASTVTNTETTQQQAIPTVISTVTSTVTSLKGSPYPGRNALNQVKEPKQIAEKLRNIKTKADHQLLLDEYQHQRDCVRWVWVNLLTDAERQQLKPIIAGEIVQLDLSAITTEATVDLKVGDRAILDCPPSPYHNQLVTIIRPAKTEGYFVAQFNDGKDSIFSEKDMKKVEQMQLPNI